MPSDDQQNLPLVVVTGGVPGRPRVPGASVRIAGPGRPSRGAVLEAVRGASVVVSMYFDKVDAEFLDAAGPGLRGVCNYAVGYNNIDLGECGRRKIVVANTPDAVTEGTANLAWLLIMASARRLVEADRFARSAEYGRRGPLGIEEFLGRDLSGRTLLIVGAGRIGYATALRSMGWGMKVLYVARTRHLEFEMAPMAGRRVDLEEGLREADVVSIHTPLTEQTRHLIDGRAIALMKPTAILVNTARGPIVEEGALVAALRERRIWGAGLDVYEDEPRLAPGLAECEHAVLTPHIGSAEEKYRELMTEMVCLNASAILEGRTPPNLVAAG